MFGTLFSTAQLSNLAPSSPIQLENIGTPPGVSIKILNQSQYIINVFNDNVQVDSVSPYSFVIRPLQKAMYVTLNPLVTSTLIGELQQVTYVTIDSQVPYQTGSLQFTGALVTSILNNDLTISSGTVSLASGSIQASIAPGSTLDVNVLNSSLTVASSPGSPLEVTVGNAALAVDINGTPNINVASGSMYLLGTADVNIVGTPTFNVGSMPNVSIASGTINLASGTQVKITNNSFQVENTTGGTLQVGGTIDIGSVPNITVASGTINLASGTQVSLTNQTFDVQNTAGGTLQVGGTIDIGNTANVSVIGPTDVNVLSSPAILISGTTSVNVDNVPAVIIQSGTVSIDATNNAVTIAGTPKVAIDSTNNNVQITGTPTFAIASGTTVNASIQNASINSNVINDYISTNPLVKLWTTSITLSNFAPGNTNYQSPVIPRGVYDELFLLVTSSSVSAIDATYYFSIGETYSNNVITYLNNTSPQLTFITEGYTTTYGASYNLSFNSPTPMDTFSLEIGNQGTTTVNDTLTIVCYGKYANDNVRINNPVVPTNRLGYIGQSTRVVNNWTTGTQEAFFTSGGTNYIGVYDNFYIILKVSTIYTYTIFSASAKLSSYDIAINYNNATQDNSYGANPYWLYQFSYSSPLMMDGIGLILVNNTGSTIAYDSITIIVYGWKS